MTNNSTSNFFFFNLMYQADFYKVSHKAQYPADVTHVHSVLVARGANYNDHISKTHSQWFGYSIFLAKLQEFEDWFMNLGIKEITAVLDEYKEFLDARLGGNNDVSHWHMLWNDNKTLPIVIHAMPERSVNEFQTPLLTVENTHPDFYWLTSFIETTMLANVWGVCNSANRSYHIRQLIESYFEGYTDEEKAGIDFMAHDFSYRGMMGDEAAMLSGCGHLANFKGSDTLPAAKMMEAVYGEITGFSVPATEHSVMCAGGKDDERGTYDRLLDIYPTGIVSIVSDTWDYFNTLDNILPSLKEKIMARDGKTVIRPDSGDPVDIICGHDIKDYSDSDLELEDLYEWIAENEHISICNKTPHGEEGPYTSNVVFTYKGKYYSLNMTIDWNRYDKQYYFSDGYTVGEVVEIQPTLEQRGSLEILDQHFGHTLDSKGLKVLDSHIGLIYGDGMNMDRIKAMLDRMVSRGYSPLNIVFGIGAFTYQLTTRDELSFAFKATAVKKGEYGEWVSLQKDPKTDPGKRSLTGRFIGGGLEKVFG